MKKLIAACLALVLALALACGASAETVQAKPAEIDPANLEGRMVKTDIEYRDGGKMLLTLYAPERFDAAAIRAVQPGDTIVTDGEEVKIETVEADGPDIVFNRGTENEMLFCDAGKGTFEHVGLNDIVPDIKLGSHDRRHSGRPGDLPRRPAHGTAEESGRRHLRREERGRGL